MKNNNYVPLRAFWGWLKVFGEAVIKLRLSWSICKKGYKKATLYKFGAEKPTKMKLSMKMKQVVYIIPISHGNDCHNMHIYHLERSFKITSLKKCLIPDPNCLETSHSYTATCSSSSSRDKHSHTNFLPWNTKDITKCKFNISNTLTLVIVILYEQGKWINF